MKTSFVVLGIISSVLILDLALLPACVFAVAVGGYLKAVK